MSWIEIKILSAAERGLMYAEACFETFRVIQGKVFMRDYHQQRMQRGLACFGITVHDHAMQQLFDDAIRQVSADDMLLRLTVSGGEAPWGLLRHEHTQARAWLQMLTAKTVQPLQLQLVDYPFPIKEKLAKFTSDYGEMLRASHTWQIAEHSSPLLSSENHLISTMTANIAVFDGEQWWTPQGKGVLAGCVRQFLLDEGFIQQRRISNDEMNDVQAMLCMNSGVFIQPVSHVRMGQRVWLLNPQHKAIVPLRLALQQQAGVGI